MITRLTIRQIDGAEIEAEAEDGGAVRLTVEDRGQVAGAATIVLTRSEARDMLVWLGRQPGALE